MKLSKNVVVWFEIPVQDMARATAFYSKVLDTELAVTEFGGTKMAVFPGSGDKAADIVHGALVQGDDYAPGDKGPILYLNGGQDLSAPLSRVEAAGGKIIMPKTAIGEHGHCAMFLDTEGNRLALHSPE